MWHIPIPDTLAAEPTSLWLGGFSVGALQCPGWFQVQEVITSSEKSGSIGSILRSYDRKALLRRSELAVTQPRRSLVSPEARARRGAGTGPLWPARGTSVTAASARRRVSSLPTKAPQHPSSALSTPTGPGNCATATDRAQGTIGLGRNQNCDWFLGHI